MRKQLLAHMDDPGCSTDADASNDELDAALARISRLEMTLAASGGVMHDANNLLTILAGELFMMTERVREQPELLAHCRTARNTAERICTLVREMLDAARDPEDDETVVCPASHAKAMSSLLRRVIGSGHELIVNCSEDPWTISGSASQLESAIANLVMNAHEALDKPGKITVSVDNVLLNNDEAHRLNLGGGCYVRLQVADTGVGIADATLASVTEALVTTKPPGKGNGMGLTMVKRFAMQTGGTVKIASRLGQGTTIDVWLPRSRETGDATANMTLPLSTLPAGDETVLLMSRDEDAQGMIRQLLEALGYTVLAASSESDARRYADQSPSVSVIICDRSVAEQANERAWLADMRAGQAELRHLAIIEAGEDGRMIAPDADACLHKPISIAELATTMRSVVSGDP